MKKLKPTRIPCSEVARLIRLRCPTCGGDTEGLLSGLGLANNGGHQIWFCFFPCNKIVTAQPNS